jgi:tRNA A37 threonylcarbamoyladenosine dehydratase
MNNIHQRQTAIYNPADHADIHVTVIGLGNVGSHVALALARMGIQKFTLVDFDTVELHNTASQAYEESDARVGLSKVTALKILMDKVATTEITLHAKAYDASIAVENITIVAVDTMATRIDISDILRQHYPNTHVIDGRMGGGQIEVHQGNVADWTATLTSEADTDECSARYISYTSYIIAGLIANTVKRVLKNQELPTSLYMHTDTLEILKK